MAGEKPPNAREQVRGNGPAGEPVAAHRSRFCKLPAWALLPRDVTIGLCAIIAAGVIILLVLSGQ